MDSTLLIVLYTEYNTVLAGMHVEVNERLDVSC